LRYIRLRHIVDEDAVPPIDFDYLEVIKTILSGAQMPQGVTYGEIEQALNILEKVKEQKEKTPNLEYLAVEDAEHTFLSEWVKQHKWPRAHEVIRDFCDAVIKAPKKKPEPEIKLVGVDNLTATAAELEAAATG
jgi:hypothetical protein